MNDTRKAQLDDAWYADQNQDCGCGHMKGIHQDGKCYGKASMAKEEVKTVVLYYPHQKLHQVCACTAFHPAVPA